MSAHHTGRPITYHGNLAFLQTAAYFLNKCIYIDRRLIPVFKMLWQDNGIAFLPHGAGLAPVHFPKAFSPIKYLLSARTAQALRQPVRLCRKHIIQGKIKLLQQILCICMDRHVCMDGRLLQLLFVNVIDNNKCLPCPGLIIIPNLPDT